MKHVITTNLNAWDESGEKIYIYSLEDENELDELREFSHDDLLELFGFMENNPEFGEIYYRYEFEFTFNFIIVIERVAYNI